MPQKNSRLIDLIVRGQFLTLGRLLVARGRKEMHPVPALLMLVFAVGVAVVTISLAQQGWQTSSQAQTVPPPPPGATLNLTANPTTVPPGSSTTLTWDSTNLTSCTASGGWTGTKAVNGTETIVNITTAKTFTLTCSGFAVSSIVKSVTVNLSDVTPPTISAISSGTPSETGTTITWTTNEASDSQIEYGLTTSYGSSTVLNSSMVTSHSVPLTGLSAAKLYHYRVKSKDAAANLTTSSDQTFTTSDTTAPTAPTGLQATATSSTQINLTWTASTDNVGVTGYRVERCQGTGCTTFTQIGTPAANSYSDVGLAANTSYRYQVRAIDAANNLSPYSAIVGATTQAPADTTPPVISAITAGSITQTGATITWTTNEASDTQVEYGLTTSYGSSTTLNTALVTAHSAPLTGLLPARTYNYRVKSKDAAANLSTSANQTFTTPDTTAPAAPTGLQATAASSTQINLTWTASTDNVGVTGYRVERCQGSTCTNFTQMGTPASTAYNDTALSASTTYRYRVRAADAAGNLSVYSSMVNATTQNPPPIACSTYPAPVPLSSFPVGFGVPWDVFATNNPLLAKADCATNAATFTAGTGSTNQYIWHQTYYTRDGSTWETPLEFQGATKTTDNLWFIGNASATQALTGAELALQNFFVSYVCTWNGTDWKCGCRDQASCTANGMWMLQGFKR